MYLLKAREGNWLWLSDHTDTWISHLKSHFKNFVLQFKDKLENLNSVCLQVITKMSRVSIIWSNSAWAVQIFGMKLLLFLNRELWETWLDKVHSPEQAQCVPLDTSLFKQHSSPESKRQFDLPLAKDLAKDKCWFIITWITERSWQTAALKLCVLCKALR